MSTTAKVVLDLYNSVSGCHSQIPKRIKNLIERREFRHSEGLGAIEDNLKSLVSGEIIILSGDPGCGKTVAAIYGGLQFSAKTQRLFYFMTSREYLKCQFKDGICIIDGIEVEPESVRTLLIIDDLGREYFTEKGWGIDQWDSFFDKRYRDQLPTLITTNMNPEELADKYNERILDRLRECGNWVGLSGKSMRKKKK